MASAMRADLDNEMDDQFEMSLEDVSDPVVPVEPPPTMSHAAAGEERGSVGLRMRMEGLTPGGYRYRTRSRTGSLRRGRPRSSSSEPRGRKSVISELEAAKSVARLRQSSTEISGTRTWCTKTSEPVTILSSQTCLEKIVESESSDGSEACESEVLDVEAEVEPVRPAKSTFL